MIIVPAIKHPWSNSFRGLSFGPVFPCSHEYKVISSSVHVGMLFSTSQGSCSTSEFLKMKNRGFPSPARFNRWITSWIPGETDFSAGFVRIPAASRVARSSAS
jgi:hypothetical protein